MFDIDKGKHILYSKTNIWEPLIWEINLIITEKTKNKYIM